MFYVLCEDYLGGPEEMVNRLMQQPKVRLLLPLWCKVQPNKTVVWFCKAGILQYCVLRTAAAIVSLILEWLDLYGEGDWSLNRGYIWVTILNNVNVTIALYFVALLYRIGKDELAPYKPLLKFMVIKMIIFFAYWQGGALSDRRSRSNDLHQHAVDSCH